MDPPLKLMSLTCWLPTFHGKRLKNNITYLDGREREVCLYISHTRPYLFCSYPMNTKIQSSPILLEQNPKGEKPLRHANIISVSCVSSTASRSHWAFGRCLWKFLHCPCDGLVRLYTPRFLSIDRSAQPLINKTWRDEAVIARFFVYSLFRYSLHPAKDSEKTQWETDLKFQVSSIFHISISTL